MIAELGQFALILSLCAAVVLAIFPMAGSYLSQPNWMALARPAALLQLLLVSISYLALTSTFITGDYSVLYAANTSNSQLPMIYKISGVWGGHEGSILLWVWVLAIWTGAVAIFSKHMPAVLLSRVLSILGMISIGFLLFVLLTSNPFERLFPVPMDGASLNPLLQDPGMSVSLWPSLLL
jgi:cytochrome c-type biogenesis protein CcmF